MKIKFCGAAQFVTGSCFYVESSGYKFLVDCGMFQGKDDEKNETRDFPFDERKIDFVLLTHAHTDHAGRLPLLVKNGFKGKIYTTPATIRLCEIMLYDSAHIQEVEAEWVNRKNKRGTLDEHYTPIYDSLDVDATLPLFEPVEYNELFKISEGIKVRFVDAGHLLGSASIEVFLTEKGKEEKIVFSGDLGNFNQPIIKNSPTYIDDADIVVTESTYGDELHKVNTEVITSMDRAKKLADLVDETFKAHGNVVIPAFAVGRTQELLYLFNLIDFYHLLPYEVPVYVDSPMAIRVTNIFSNEDPANFDEETRSLIKKGDNPISFPSLHLALSVEDSKAINELQEPCVIISASGMCSQGRIKHHLKHNLWRPESTILFTGYQAGGTLGRSILDGAKTVKIFGEKINVVANIRTLQSLSGHADQRGIIKWIEHFDKNRLKQVFVVHGEKDSALFFQDYLKNEMGISAYAPEFNEEIDIRLSMLPVLPVTNYTNRNNNEEKKAIKAALKVLEGKQASLQEIVKKLQNLANPNVKADKSSQWEDVNTILALADRIDEIHKEFK